MTICTYCRRPVTHPHRHHPDRERSPDYTVPMHEECHRRHYRDRGDCARWGAMARTAGREGYERTLEACERFHELGGLARAAGARRDARGRFA